MNKREPNTKVNEIPTSAGNDKEFAFTKTDPVEKGIETLLLPEMISVPAEPETEEDMIQQLLDSRQPEITIERPRLRFYSLRSGCYLVSFNRTSPPFPFGAYDGTLRIEKPSRWTCRASGDLYHRPIHWVWVTLPGGRRIRIPTAGPGPDPAAGIPIQARSEYAAYLRVTSIAGGLLMVDHFTLKFEIWNFDHATRDFIKTETCSAVMYWKTAPIGFTDPDEYLEGTVTNAAGTVLGQLRMGWVSSAFRKAEVEIDQVRGLAPPLNNGLGKTWADVFREAGWKVSVKVSDSNLPDEPDGSWNEADLHRTMLVRRDAISLDEHWRYYFLCVPHSPGDSLFGIMFDAYGSDSNHVPREGAAVFAHTTFGNEAYWGSVRNQQLDATPCYFRTAVHEVGHALLLFHPSSAAGDFILQRTVQIALHAEAAGLTFPDNVIWSFSPEDLRLLRHLPDPVVRPGGEIRFDEDVSPGYAGVPLPSADLAKLGEMKLEARPVLETIPLGAPVRVELALTNTSPEAQIVPARLSLKNGMLTGKVIDSNGNVRRFLPVVRRIEKSPYDILDPKEYKTGSLTLLRGPEGALFPGQGVYRIITELNWMMNDYPVYLAAETQVMITPVVDEAHAKNALKVLSEPDTLLVLAIGGDYMKEGVQAIQAVLGDLVLGPHYTFIEAKRVVEASGKRRTNLKAAAEMIRDDTVMSAGEIDKMASLVQKAPVDSEPARVIAQALKRKVASAQVDDKIKNRVDSL